MTVYIVELKLMQVRRRVCEYLAQFLKQCNSETDSSNVTFLFLVLSFYTTPESTGGAAVKWTPARSKRLGKGHLI